MVVYCGYSLQSRERSLNLSSRYTFNLCMPIDNRGEKNPNYKHGRYYIGNSCAICGIKIDPRSTYCHKCRPDRGNHSLSNEAKAIIGKKSSAKFTPEYIARMRDKYRGRRTTAINGYILVKDYEHPNRNSHDYVLEHVLVMSEYLGRPIAKGEIVHHIDGDRSNNSIDNLYLCESRKAHSQVHYSLVELARSLLDSGIISFDKSNGKYKLS